ncbi:MAG: hypothetical protein Q4A44_01020 [Bacteroidales bacterium]|nr:hypothetical protein [Bacteroidales bacterium]
MYRISRVAFRLFESRSIAIFIVTLFCIRFFPLEGHDISPIKVGLMALTPLLILLQPFIATRTLLIAIAFWLVCFSTAVYNTPMRFSTLAYLGGFLITFSYYTSLLRRGVFTFPFFTKLLRILIIGYSVVLIGQQVCLLMGIKHFALLNLVGQPYLSVDKLPSLTREPSHTARIMAVAYLCYLRCLQITYGKKPSLTQLINRRNRWVTLLFLWSMITMGSGTAYICLALLSLFFIRLKNAVVLIPLMIVAFSFIYQIENKSLQRAIKTAHATTTLNTDNVIETDGSAAVRIIPLINTLTKTDLTAQETWLGQGTLQKGKLTIKGMYEAKHGILMQYGFIALILSICLAYTSIIWKFWSVETSFFIVIFGFSLGNIDYAWGAYMLLASSKYFLDKHRKHAIPSHEYEEALEQLTTKTPN